MTDEPKCEACDRANAEFEKADTGDRSVWYHAYEREHHALIARERERAGIQERARRLSHSREHNGRFETCGYCNADTASAERLIHARFKESSK